MLMVAVKVTFCPDTDGLVLATTAVPVLALLTVWVTAVELLTLKLLSPLYEVVIECVPTARLEALKLAVVVPPLLLKLP